MGETTRAPADGTAAEDATTVLIVEDEDNVRETYELYVETEGYDIRLAANGGEAIVELDEDVDVVLLDRRMPGMSGDEVLEHIEEWGLDCRVVMVTAVDPDEDVVEMGFDDYLSKPVSKDEVLTTIEHLLLFDRYEELLTEYHGVTKTYATLRSNLESGANTAQLEALEAERDALQAEIEDTIDAFTDEAISEAFADIHNLE